MIADKMKEIIAHRKESLKISEYFVEENGAQPFNSEKRSPFSQSIRNCPGIAIISEIKPASPTTGLIRGNINAKEISTLMEKSGAIGLSILTEPNYFQGSYKNLKIAVENTSIPCLMKDFVMDEIQFKIAAHLGATNILLINSIIELEAFYELAMKYNLEPLIEIHSENELKDIEHLIEIGYSPKLIGVNNRNLHTLEINLDTSQKIIPKIKERLGEDLIIISESGIQSYKDILRLQRAKADAFLIGTLIMQSENISKMIKSLRGEEV